MFVQRCFSPVLWCRFERSVSGDHVVYTSHTVKGMETWKHTWFKHTLFHIVSAAGELCWSQVFVLNPVPVEEDRILSAQTCACGTMPGTLVAEGCEVEICPQTESSAAQLLKQHHRSEEPCRASKQQNATRKKRRTNTTNGPKIQCTSYTRNSWDICTRGRLAALAVSAVTHFPKPAARALSSGKRTQQQWAWSHGSCLPLSKREMTAQSRRPTLVPQSVLWQGSGGVDMWVTFTKQMQRLRKPQAQRVLAPVRHRNKAIEQEKGVEVRRSIEQLHQRFSEKTEVGKYPAPHAEACSRTVGRRFAGAFVRGDEAFVPVCCWVGTRCSAGGRHRESGAKEPGRPQNATRRIAERGPLAKRAGKRLFRKRCGGTATTGRRRGRFWPRWSRKRSCGQSQSNLAVAVQQQHESEQARERTHGDPSTRKVLFQDVTAVGHKARTRITGS